MIRCLFCDHENPPGATSCANCHAQLAGAQDAAQQPDVDPVRELLKRGKKIEAIQIYRQRTGAGLKEAKDAVEAMERGEQARVPKAALETFGQSDVETFVTLLRQGKKILAIKLYREKTGVGLADAKAAVETLAAEQGIQVRGSGCAGAVLFCGLLGLVAARVVFRL